MNTTRTGHGLWAQATDDRTRLGPAALRTTRWYYSAATRLLLPFMFRVCLLWQLHQKHNFNIFGLSHKEAARRHSGWNGVLSQVKSSFFGPLYFVQRSEWALVQSIHEGVRVIFKRQSKPPSPTSNLVPSRQVTKKDMWHQLTPTHLWRPLTAEA